MDSLKDLVDFVLWLQPRENVEGVHDFSINRLTREQLRKLARDYWDQQHGHD